MAPPPSAEINEIRRQRLIELLETKFDGNQSALARALSRQPDYISKCLAPVGRTRKKIGEQFARYIEERLDLPSGWMDKWEGTGMPFLSAQAIEFALRFDTLTAEQKQALQAVLKAIGPHADEKDGKNDPAPARQKNQATH